VRPARILMAAMKIGIPRRKDSRSEISCDTDSDQIQELHKALLRHALHILSRMLFCKYYR
jgi:hypothetical protein